MRGVRVDGLTIATGVRLPGVPSVRGGRADWTLAIDRGAPEDGWPGEFAVTGGVRGRGGTWAQFARHDARRAVLVRPWFRLTADPEPGTARLRHARPRGEDRLVVRRALPYLSALRGRLVLHAACAVLPAGAVVFCADARTGKSTLALALDATGCPVLGDDHVALDARDGTSILAHPSVPWVEVAARSVRFLRPDVARPEREGPVPLRTARPVGGVPLAGLVLLRRGRALSRRPLAGARLLPRLIRRFAFVGDPADAAETAARFDVALRLVTGVPCHSVTLPEGLRRLHESLATMVGWWKGETPGG
jgi:hypothetical protein